MKLPLLGLQQLGEQQVEQKTLEEPYGLQASSAELKAMMSLEVAASPSQPRVEQMKLSLLGLQQLEEPQVELKKLEEP